MPPKKETAPTISVRPDALKDKSVIITGEIPGRSRKAAEQILIDAGAKIEKSLNKKVQLVVLGENAGPAKLEKIEQMGVPTKEWDDLIEEIRGDGPAAGPSDDNATEASGVAEEAPKPEKAATKRKAESKKKDKPAASKANTSQPRSSSSQNTYFSGKKVIITGAIPGHDRKSAHNILESAGAQVEKSLNKQVKLVILGANAGPDKLKKVEDMCIETITWEDLASKLDIKVAPNKEVAEVEVGEAPASIDGMTVIITGTIEGQTRTAAQKLLEGAGAKYARSLNKSVQLVVLGSNPGPDKLSKIAEMGIQTCEFETLVEKLGLGLDDKDAEAEPPKKRARRT